MKSEILNVEGMSCAHCVNAITKAVGSLKGVENVSVNLEDKTVSVRFKEGDITLDKIKEEIEEQGYDII